MITEENMVLKWVEGNPKRKKDYCLALLEEISIACETLQDKDECPPIRCSECPIQKMLDCLNNEIIKISALVK